MFFQNIGVYQQSQGEYFVMPAEGSMWSEHCYCKSCQLPAAFITEELQLPNEAKQDS